MIQNVHSDSLFFNEWIYLWQDQLESADDRKTLAKLGIRDKTIVTAKLSQVAFSLNTRMVWSSVEIRYLDSSLILLLHSAYDRNLSVYLLRANFSLLPKYQYIL